MNNIQYLLEDKSDIPDVAKVIYSIYEKELEKYKKRKILYLLLIFLFLGPLVGLSTYQFYNFYPVILFLSAGSILVFILYFTNKIKTRINKIDLVFLPVSQMKFHNKSILIDRSGLIDPTEFKFKNLQHQDILKLNEKYKEIYKLANEIPHLLSSNQTREITPLNEINFDKKKQKIFDEETRFLNITNEIETILSNVQTYDIQLKSFMNNPNFLDGIKSFTNYHRNNILEESSIQDIKESIDKIKGIYTLHSENKIREIDVDTLCININSFYENCIPKMEYVVHNSFNQIIMPQTFTFINTIENASYNYYCPQCNKKLIEQLETFDYFHDNEKDKRVFFPSNTLMEISDIEKGIWKCPLCNYETQTPFARHKMEDELFTPVYDKLYEENYIERLHIYNHINDEKRKYSEKAETLFHEVMRESRTKVDTIKSKVRTITAEINSDEIAIRDLNSLLKKYNKISKNKAEEIENDLLMHKKLIQEENEKSRKRIDKSIDKAQKNIKKATNKYSKLEREDQAKRDAIQKQIAANTKETAKNTNAIKKNTASIAKSSKATAHNTSNIAKNTKETNKILKKNLK